MAIVVVIVEGIGIGVNMLPSRIFSKCRGELVVALLGRHKALPLPRIIEKIRLRLGVELLAHSHRRSR